MNQKQFLPNSTAVLVLGICSIVFGCIFVGLILGILGLTLSDKGRRMYKQNPDLYEGYGALNAGFIMSIIGTALSGIYVIYWFIAAVIFGSATMAIWNIFQGYY